MKVKLLNKTKKHNLENDKIYYVLGIEADYLRIIDEDGYPYLFPIDIFMVVDKSLPEDWITEYGDDNEKYSYPIELNKVGFFEDYFDKKKYAINSFNKYVEKLKC